MSRDLLRVATYNTYRERAGRDALLDGLLRDGSALTGLQEVHPRRAWEVKRAFGRRAYVSPVKHGWQFLALILPAEARFLARRSYTLNGYGGLVPSLWSLRRGYALRKVGRRGWKDGLEPRVVQEARVSWRGRELGVVNTHLPYEAGLRDRCLSRFSARVVPGLPEDALVLGDLNAVPGDLFLADLLLAGGFESAGPGGRATHAGGLKIDHVLYRGGFREVGYGTRKGSSDHLLVEVELEVV